MVIFLSMDIVSIPSHSSSAFPLPRLTPTSKITLVEVSMEELNNRKEGLETLLYGHHMTKESIHDSY